MTPFSTHPVFRRFRVSLVAATALACATLFAAAPAKKNFDLPAGTADQTLRQFSVQSGVEVVFPTAVARDMRTRAVKGEMAPREALERLVEGTGFVITQDPKSGAFSLANRPAAQAPEPKKAAARAETLPEPRAANAPASKADDAILLTAFEVKADASDSYQALNTTAISGTNIELRRLPVTAEILTRTMLDDLALADGHTTLLTATSLTAPTSPSATGTDPAGGLAGDRFTIEGFGIRGVAAGVPRRNGFLDSRGGLIDNFFLNRYEIVRGPQSLLYGAGGSGGLINLISKRPSLGRNRYRADLAIYEEAGFRTSAEADVTLTLPGQRKLGLLAAAQHTERGNFRPNIRRESDGWFVAGTLRAFPKTTLRFEASDIAQTSVTPNFIRNTLSAPNHADPDLRRLNGQLVKRIFADEPKSVTDKIAQGKLSFDTLDSLAGEFAGEWLRESYNWGAVEQEVGDWLGVQLQVGKMQTTRINRNLQAGGSLVAPANFNDAWIVNVRPQTEPSYRVNEGARATANVALDRLTRAVWLKGNFTFGGEFKLTKLTGEQRQPFELDGSGNVIVNPAALTNATSGRNLAPTLPWDIGQGFAGPFRPNQSTYTIAGRTYALASQRVPGVLPPTAANPFGYGPDNSSTAQTRTQETGLFGSVSTTWWRDRIDAFAGFRLDRFKTKNPIAATRVGPIEENSITAGLNVHLPHGFTPYYGRSSNYRPPTGSNHFNELPPAGRGEGEEFGVKVSALDQRITGSLAFYRIESIDDQSAMPAIARNAADPVSAVNGRRHGGPQFSYDRESRGFEVALSGQPIRNWRVSLSFAKSDGKEGRDVFLPILYNDQFRTDASGQLVMDNGQVLTVPLNPALRPWNPRAPTAGVPAQPLTVGILRSGDASGNYRATLDPVSGVILNSNALFMDAAQSGVGTAVTGLPLSQHQLGFAGANNGRYLATRGGDLSSGYAAHVFNVATVYSFREGWLKGVSVGGNVRIEDGWRGYFYNNAAGQRTLHRYPDLVQTGVRLAYERKLFQRYAWKTQINLTNALDKRTLRRLPGDGGTVLGVAYDAVPREAIWTNTISF